MHHRILQKHRRRALRAAALAGLLALSACSSYQVRLPDSDPLVPEYQTTTMHTYFWGLINKPRTFDAECGDEAINDVVVERNYAMDLASVLTLGIWAPVDVKFRCRAPRTRVEPFPSESDTSTN